MFVGLLDPLTTARPHTIYFYILFLRNLLLCNVSQFIGTITKKTIPIEKKKPLIAQIIIDYKHIYGTADPLAPFRLTPILILFVPTLESDISFFLISEYQFAIFGNAFCFVLFAANFCFYFWEKEKKKKT